MQRSDLRASLLAVWASSLLAAGASAATLGISTDKAVYAPGEPIVITVEGDSEGAQDIGLFGMILYDTNGLVGPSATLYTPLSDLPGNPSWIAGGVGGCSGVGVSPGQCVAFNMITPELGTAVGIGSPEPFVYAVIGANAGLPGTYSLQWETEPLGNQLVFFGLSSAPGATYVVTPEPSAGVMLALGLVGLGARGRPAARRAGGHGSGRLITCSDSRRARRR